MYATASEIEMDFHCDFDAGPDAKNWPPHIRIAAGDRQRLHEQRMAPRQLIDVKDRCESMDNHFILSRTLTFEPPSPDLVRSHSGSSGEMAPAVRPTADGTLRDLPSLNLPRSAAVGRNRTEWLS